MNKIQLGEFIRDTRKAKGLSQQALADKAGLTRRQQILEMENAQCDYGIDVLIKVLNALDYEPTISDIKSIASLPVAIVDTIFNFKNIESAIEETPKEKFGKIKKKK